MDGQWYEPAGGISIRMKGFDQRVNETENGVGGGVVGRGKRHRDDL